MSKTLLLLLFCLAAGLYQNRASLDLWLHPPKPRPPGEERVVLFATSWCGYCAKTRQFFAANHIDYLELDVEKSEQGQRGYAKLGGNGVPIVVIDDITVIRGYDPAGINEALSRSP